MSTVVSERHVVVNGLSHHVVEWSPQDPPRETVILCHGFLDLAWSWRDVAEGLVAHGYRVAAFDWRGHGETDWVGPGGYYHFADYVLDLHQVLPHLTERPAHLVGHSMGGTACALYAGTRAAPVRSLTLVEGLGPPACDAAVAPERYRVFLKDVERIRATTPRVLRDREEALTRMRFANPGLGSELGAFLAEKATRPTDGGFVFRFDPLHRSTSPTPFNLEAFQAFLEAIEVPTLLVFGDSGYRLDDETARIRHLAHATTVELAEVGHMVHWFAPDDLVASLIPFFAELDHDPA